MWRFADEADAGVLQDQGEHAAVQELPDPQHVSLAPISAPGCPCIATASFRPSFVLRLQGARVPFRCRGRQHSGNRLAQHCWLSNLSDSSLWLRLISAQPQLFPSVPKLIASLGDKCKIPGKKGTRTFALFPPHRSGFRFVRRGGALLCALSLFPRLHVCHRGGCTSRMRASLSASPRNSCQ